MVTKNIIVSQIADFKNTEPKFVRGLVTLIGSGNITGILKLFNVPNDILPIAMAIKIGDKKYIYTDIDDPQNYNFKMVNAPNSENITILIAYIKENYVQGIACGQNAGGNAPYDDLFGELSDAELDSLINNELDKTELFSLAESDLKFPDDEKDENNIDSTDEKVDAPSVEKNGNFYSLIQPQLDELFARFPHFKQLEDLVENTEWIKVSYSDDGSKHYILGKLYDGAEVTHLCYGIPAPSRSTAPPSNLTDYCQWLPLNLDKPDDEGYWVMYQNAETGENVRL